MINNVVLIGRLTRDPELRYTPTNIAATQFNLACNRNFKNQNGEYDADFVNCVMWRQQAENFANWVRKAILSASLVASRPEITKAQMANVCM